MLSEKKIQVEAAFWALGSMTLAIVLFIVFGGLFSLSWLSPLLVATCIVVPIAVYGWRVDHLHKQIRPIRLWRGQTGPIFEDKQNDFLVETEDDGFGDMYSEAITEDSIMLPSGMVLNPLHQGMTEVPTETAFSVGEVVYPTAEAGEGSRKPVAATGYQNMTLGAFQEAIALQAITNILSVVASDDALKKNLGQLDLREYAEKLKEQHAYYEAACYYCFAAKKAMDPLVIRQYSFDAMICFVKADMRQESLAIALALSRNLEGMKTGELLKLDAVLTSIR